ncbi:MAG: SAP domain-containing protein [Flavobacterium sp.]
MDYIRYFKDNVDLRKRTIPELKKISRENGLFVSGAKPLLIERIQKHFARIKRIIQCQSYVRRNLVMSRLKMRGPALTPGKRKLCVNDTDFFTLEPISEIEPDNFFSYQDEKGLVYGFDVKSLSMMYDSQGSLMNPYNRYVFTGEILQRINSLIRKPKTRTNDEAEMETFNRLIELRTKPIQTRITDIFYEIDRLGNYTVSEWFSRLSREKYLYLYKRIRELWNYRAMLEDDMKRSICPFFDPFQFRMSRYSGYVNTQRERDMTESDCRKMCVITIENLIYTGRDDIIKNIMVAHILSALTLVSAEARTTMPWLYDSIVYLFSL